MPVASSDLGLAEIALEIYNEYMLGNTTCGSIQFNLKLNLKYAYSASLQYTSNLEATSNT